MDGSVCPEYSQRENSGTVREGNRVMPKEAKTSQGQGTGQNIRWNKGTHGPEAGSDEGKVQDKFCEQCKGLKAHFIK